MQSELAIISIVITYHLNHNCLADISPGNMDFPSLHDQIKSCLKKCQQYMVEMSSSQ